MPAEQPKGYRKKKLSARPKNTKDAHKKRIREGRIQTQHTRLPPRQQG